MTERFGQIDMNLEYERTQPFQSRAIIMTSLRFLAYIRQITKAITESGAEAIAFWAWGLFLASNAPSIAYAVENKQDWTTALKLVMPLPAVRSC
jgi:hypothetical protein